jgi:predicted RNA binding protein YcfA (HicA-like mRNA interferase family)
MPKLPALKPRQIIRFLEQNGFALDHTSGSHFVSTIQLRVAER